MSNPVKFEDNQGKVIWLDGDLALADLLKRGVKQVRLEQEGQPLADGWWVAANEEDRCT